MLFEAHTVASSVSEGEKSNGLENGLIIVVYGSVGVQ